MVIVWADNHLSLLCFKYADHVFFSYISPDMSSLTLSFQRIALETLCYQAPSWLRGEGLDRSQDGRWLLVCRVWIPTGHLVQQTQTTGWRKTLPGRGCRDLFPSSSLFVSPSPPLIFPSCLHVIFSSAYSFHLVLILQGTLCFSCSGYYK